MFHCSTDHSHHQHNVGRTSSKFGTHGGSAGGSGTNLITSRNIASNVLCKRPAKGIVQHPMHIAGGGPPRPTYDIHLGNYFSANATSSCYPLGICCCKSSGKSLVCAHGQHICTLSISAPSPPQRMAMHPKPYNLHPARQPMKNCRMAVHSQ